MTGRAIAALAIAVSSLGCPGPRAPTAPAATPLTIDVGRPRGSLRGVAGDGEVVFTASRLDRAGADAEPPSPLTVVEAWRGDKVTWTTRLDGGAGPIAATSGLVAVALGGTGPLGAASGGPQETPTIAPVRGEPGAMVVALDARTGAPSWRILLDTSEWVVITAVAPAPDGLIVGGTFSGSLRVVDRKSVERRARSTPAGSAEVAADHVVTSGGRADGFVARLSAKGEVAWLIRVGGPGPDAVQGVAAHEDRIAIAGTFAAGADLLGQPLAAFDEKSPFPDGFVATLDAEGVRVWSATFGGKYPESVAGVAIDGAGRVAVAANARDVVHVAGVDIVAEGAADGLVAWWSATGTATHATRIGGAEFDGLRAITSVGELVVVGGFYSGTLRLGERDLVAGGGDGAFLAAYDGRGVLRDQWELQGAGREEIAALAAVPGGFIAGIAYTADATLDGARLPAPADPMAGAAVIVRPVR